MRELLFKKTFGFKLESLGFEVQLNNLIKILGPAKIYETLKKEYSKNVFDVGDLNYEGNNWGIIFENNKLTTLIMAGEKYRLNETPNMRKKIVPHLKLIFNSKSLNPAT